MQWLLANLFLLAIVLIGVGFMFIFGSAVQAMHLGADTERWVFMAAMVAALFATYYAVKWLHRQIERRMFDKSRRRSAH